MNSSEETNFCRRAFLRTSSATLLVAVLGASGESESQTNIHRGNHTMSADANIVKDLMKQNLLGVFSERDAEKRRSLIAKIWDTTGIFIVGGWRCKQWCGTPLVGLRSPKRATEDDRYRCLGRV